MGISHARSSQAGPPWLGDTGPFVQRIALLVHTLNTRIIALTLCGLWPFNYQIGQCYNDPRYLSSWHVETCVKSDQTAKPNRLRAAVVGIVTVMITPFYVQGGRKEGRYDPGNSILAFLNVKLNPLV